MKSLTRIVWASLVALLAVGCTSGNTELSPEEQKAFNGGDRSGRSDAAKEGIAEFRKQWEAKHGNSKAPEGASVPGN